jgi:hypothetical protein
MEIWHVIGDWMIKVAIAAFVTGGIFLIAFACLSIMLPFYQQDSPGIEPSFSRLALLRDPSRVTGAGVRIQQRARSLLSYALMLVALGTILVALVLSLPTVFGR